MKQARKDDERPATKPAAKAADRIRDLERELAEQAEAARQTGETWRDAVHDLRGLLGVVKNSISVLNQEKASEAMRAEFLTMLREGVASMNAVLNELMSLASLQAGQEHRKVESFDVAAVVEQLCEELQPAAGARGLFLSARGPAALRVKGDRGKVRQIAYYLARIASQSIKQGGVTVTYGPCGPRGSGQWKLGVTCDGADIEAGHRSAQTEPIPTRAPPFGFQPAPPMISETIALSIVQRLCELLGARMEWDGDAENGKACSVTFPGRSDAARTQDSRV